QEEDESGQDEDGRGGHADAEDATEQALHHFVGGRMAAGDRRRSRVRRRRPGVVHQATPKPRRSIWTATRLSASTKTSRTVLLRKRRRSLAPARAPSRTPRATGAATRGRTSPRQK